MVSTKELYDALRKVKIPDNRIWNGTRMTKRDGATSGIHRKNIAFRGGRAESGVFGMTANPQSGWKPRKSKLSIQYPHVHNLLNRYIKERIPEFKYDAITVNHNLRCRKHRDSRNSTLTLITSLGDFKGGELNIQHPETGQVKTFDIRNKWLLFDGSKFTHWNNPIQGEKYSLAFYARWSDVGKKQKQNMIDYLTGGGKTLLEPTYLRPFT